MAKNTTNEAREGDVLVVLACCPSGPVAVRAAARCAWRCSKCGGRGKEIERLVLGIGAVMPGNFDPLADSPRCWKLDDAGGCSLVAAHSGNCRPNAAMKAVA